MQQEDELERALRLAAAEPASRPDFFRTLLASNIFVIGRDGDVTGTRTVQAGETLSIQNWTTQEGKPIIPFFTSIDALHRAGVTAGMYLSLSARAFFETTRGAQLVLNPRSPYGKEFFPNEIEALLATGTNETPVSHVLRRETQVLLGQPANYPNALVASLKKFFATRDQVKAAYLALMHDASRDAKPTLLIGIEIDGGDFETLSREAGTVVGDYAMKSGEAVDVFRVERGKGGLSAHMVDAVAPFYARGFGASLRRLFGAGRNLR